MVMFLLLCCQLCQKRPAIHSVHCSVQTNHNQGLDVVEHQQLIDENIDIASSLNPGY